MTHPGLVAMAEGLFLQAIANQLNEDIETPHAKGTWRKSTIPLGTPQAMALQAGSSPKHREELCRAGNCPLSRGAHPIRGQPAMPL
jgi:hypothetical protein